LEGALIVGVIDVLLLLPPVQVRPCLLLQLKRRLGSDHPKVVIG
jgi:hypothetical protein